MECAPEDVEYGHGVFGIPGTDRRIGFAEVAEMAYAGFTYPEEGFELGMEETVYYDPPAWGYPTALHLAVVAVDEETGAVAIRDYYTVDDCGRVINPIVVHGQVHGGLAQGAGQALLEEVVYEADSGQLLSGSFADYAMPRAADLPSFRLAFQETLNPNNALGAKGCSETGVAGAPAALANAVLDALAPLGVRDVALPLTAERVWRAIRDAHRAGGRAGSPSEGGASVGLRPRPRQNQ
jgi:carbon-monoxide dehydrogenase large subunit